MSVKKRVAILISGRGSNMEALVNACKQDDYPAEIVIVVSNRPKAPGLQKAQQAGIAADILDHKEFKTREAFEDALHDLLSSLKIDLICTAGFMRLLTAHFVNKWTDKILNIHPSLLPSFKGLDVHERVLQAGVKFTGCTVHFVRAEMDSGPIVAQAAVPILLNDTADCVADRVLTTEHKIYPQALRWVASEHVRVIDERVTYHDSILVDPAMQFFSPQLKSSN